VARTMRGKAATTHAVALAIVLGLQAVLGILTLIYQVPLALALMHQAMAIVALTIAVVYAQRLARPARVGVAVPGPAGAQRSVGEQAT
jgi:cytochrome c oxidase assembly protein subunit 15